jgi:hypothetical protein
MSGYLLMRVRDGPLHGQITMLRNRLLEGSGSASLRATSAGYTQGTFYRLKQ